MTKRIEYIDAMRGFTMFLVVLHHIETFGYKGIYIDSFNDIFILFRMPLFFFISGFILYKKDYDWNKINISKFLKKKFEVQIIPTIFFLSIFILLFNFNLSQVIFDSSKMGYWFTITLFEYFCLYIISNIIIKIFKIKNWKEDITLILFAIIILLLIYFFNENNKEIYNLIGVIQLRYYIFFTYGLLVKKYFNKFCNLINNGYFIGMILLLFILFTMYYNYRKNEISILLSLIKIIIGFLGITITFAFFRKYESAFTKEHKLGKVLQFIGKRTLDVYLIHYFFLPRNLKVIGEFFYNNSNPIVEFFITSIFALMVIGACLVTSSIIRISPIAGHYLFGVKKEITGNNILEKNNENVIK